VLRELRRQQLDDESGIAALGRPHFDGSRQPRSDDMNR
jgi:hypothetical protein